MIIGISWLTRTVRARWEPPSLLAGAGLAVAGVMTSAAAAFFAGLLILFVTLLAGIASNHKDPEKCRDQ